MGESDRVVPTHTVPRLSPTGWSTRRSVWGARPGGRGNLRNRNRFVTVQYQAWWNTPTARGARARARRDDQKQGKIDPIYSTNNTLFVQEFRRSTGSMAKIAQSMRATGVNVTWYSLPSICRFASTSLLDESGREVEGGSQITSKEIEMRAP